MSILDENLCEEVCSDDYWTKKAHTFLQENVDLSFIRHSIEELKAMSALILCNKIVHYTPLERNYLDSKGITHMPVEMMNFIVINPYVPFETIKDISLKNFIEPLVFIVQENTNVSQFIRNIVPLPIMHGSDLRGRCTDFSIQNH